MRIDNLKPGTKLMWDAPPNEYKDPNKRFVYPALVGLKHKSNPWVMVMTGSSNHWMGPEEENLREPTEEELKTLSWDSIKYHGTVNPQTWMK